MKKSYLVLLALHLFFVLASEAQPAPEERRLKRLYTGDPVVDLDFRYTRNFPAAVKSMADLKGKLILLDFWGIGCTSCIESFPKMAALQKEFEGKLQVLLITTYSNDSVAMAAINRLKKEEYRKAFLALPSSSGDERWQQLFPHNGVPHHVWIAPSGKVLAITSSYNATAEHIRDMLAGKHVEMMEKDDLIEYDVSNSGLIKQGHEKLPRPHYYSAFAAYYSGIGSGTYLRDDSAANTFRCTQRNMKISKLYQLATKQWRVLVETDRLPGHQVYISTDEWHKNNLISYELVIPLSERPNYRKYMLEDLNRYFGMKEGITGNIEKRMLPAYILVRREKMPEAVNKKAKTKKKAPVNEEELMKISSVKNLHNAIQYRFEDLDKRRIVVDETGMDPMTSLDLILPVTYDIEILRKQLQSYGFDIVTGEREIELLVVKNK